MSEVKTCELGDLIEFQRGYDLPKSEFRNGPYPVQSSNGILGYHIDYKVEGPGITIGRSGTVGIPHYLNENFYPHNTTLFVKDFKGNDRKYIYYLLKHLKLNDFKTGSGVPTMNRNHLHPLKVNAFIDKNYQVKLSSILSILDQKIALNNQINEELEAMAKTLYDYWFVQFDFPDENGKPYKSSGGKMVYNDQLKREIPEGWGVKKVSEIAKTGSGGTPKSTTAEYYSNGTIPWINSGELNKSIIISTTNYITEFGLEESSAKLFPADSILIAMYGATAGKVSFLAFESSTNQAICAVTLDDNRLKYYFKFFIEDLYLYLVTLSSGSARDNLSQELIRNLLMIIPDERVVENFFNLVDSYFLQITNNLKQNQELTQLRDWLLPMLMNGQVKVEDKT